jgi:voltage-gated potassium channel
MTERGKGHAWRANPKADSWRPDGGPSWRTRTYDIIFLADTPAGKTFDVLLIAAIVVSVVIVMLESVAAVSASYRVPFRTAEWVFTFLFTIEYILRLLTVRQASKYALSFFGIVDLMAILPSYLSLLVPGGQALIVIRILRVLRVFRVLKLAQYVGEARTLGAALRASRYKITVFLFTVLTIVVVVGSMMFLIEGPESGFTSIPKGVYWAIVTLTTVGYGDISPHTPIGQCLASLVMIMGYGIIAVPTGIVTAELAHQAHRTGSSLRCSSCGSLDHGAEARYCGRCGSTLESPG